MHIVFEIDDKHEEDVIIVRCRSLTSRQMKALEAIMAVESIVGYKDGAIHRIPTESVFYIDAQSDKIFIYTCNDIFEYKKRITDLEPELGDDFVRITRTVILNWKKIESLRPSLNGRMAAVLENGERQIISRQYAAELKDRFLK